jgi:hypothetical protein
MPKTSGARKSQTHFEQVPLEVVKEIAEIDDAEENTSATADTVDRPPGKMVKSGRVPTHSPARKK